MACLVYFRPTVSYRSTSLLGFTYSGFWSYKNIQTISESPGRNCDKNLELCFPEMTPLARSQMNNKTLFLSGADGD